MEVTAPSGTDYKFSESQLGARQCRITNYEDRPLLLIDFALTLTFQEVLPQPSGAIVSGDTILQRPCKDRPYRARWIKCLYPLYGQLLPALCVTPVDVKKKLKKEEVTPPDNPN
jgi:hypothetical protein